MFIVKLKKRFFHWWHSIFLPRYETRLLLQDYVIAQYGPYLSKNPQDVAEKFYKTILETAKKYIDSTSPTLDIGCATGRLVFEYEKLGAHSIGIDTSHNFISFCNQVKEGKPKIIKYPLNKSKSIFIEGDIIDSTFEDYFAFISCINVIDRVKNPVILIEKTLSLLSKDGIALFVDPYDWEMSPAPKHLHVRNMKNLFDDKSWKIIEETHLPFSMPIDKKVRKYNCHMVVIQKIS